MRCNDAARARGVCCGCCCRGWDPCWLLCATTPSPYRYRCACGTKVQQSKPNGTERNGTKRKPRKGNLDHAVALVSVYRFSKPKIEFQRKPTRGCGALRSNFFSTIFCPAFERNRSISIHRFRNPLLFVLRSLAETKLVCMLCDCRQQSQEIPSKSILRHRNHSRTL